MANLSLKEIVNIIWNKTKDKISPLEKIYLDEYATITGTFSSDDSSDWTITIGEKEYISETKDFKFVLETSLVLTPEIFEDKFERIILPKCTVQEDMSHIFADMTHIKTLDISKVNWNNAVNMSYAFANFPKYAKIIGLESLGTTHNMTTMVHNGIFTYDKDAYIDTHSLQMNATDNKLLDNFEGLEYPIPLGKFDLSSITDLSIFMKQQLQDNKDWVADCETKVDFTGSNIRPIICNNFSASHNEDWPKGIGGLDMSRCTQLAMLTYQCGKHSEEQMVNFKEIANWDTSKVTTLWYAFVNAEIQTDELYLPWDFSSMENCDHAFCQVTGVKSLNVPFKNIGNINSNYMFQNSKFEELHFGPNFDLSKGSCKGYPCSEVWNLANLKTITGNFKWQKDIGWGEIKCKLLDRESAIVLLNALPEIEDSRDCHIYTDVYNKLTEEDLAIATSKGWNIVVATSGY